MSLFGWLVADGWCWFVLREEYYWLVAGGWFVVREKYCWLVADKPNEQGVSSWLESGSVGGSSILDRTDTASTLAFVVAAFARTRMCPAHARHQIPAGGSEEIEKLPRMPWPAGR
jgi:hypothetical protein